MGWFGVFGFGAAVGRLFWLGPRGETAEGTAEIDAPDAFFAEVAELLERAVVAARELRLVAAQTIECIEPVVVRESLAEQLVGVVALVEGLLGGGVVERVSRAEQY